MNRTTHPNRRARTDRLAGRPATGQCCFNDKYDIWEVRPDGTDARLVTGGAGRKAQIVFRYVKTGAEERTIPTDKPFLVSAVNDVTKATGYYRVTPAAAAAAPAQPAKPAKGKAAAPVPALLAEVTASGEARHDGQAPRQPTTGSGPGGGPGGGGANMLLKPKNADGPFILTASRFEEFPNLWTAGPLREPHESERRQPPAGRVLMGRSELIEYINADGKKLRAILTKPENFDAAKKYR